MGSFTPSTGEVIDFVLTDIDAGLTLSEGSKVASRLPRSGVASFGTLQSRGRSERHVLRRDAFRGHDQCYEHSGFGNRHSGARGTSTGTFTGNMGFWNTATNQNTGAFSGSYTADTVTTRISGTTDILGAASFAAYQLSTNQFILVGTASGDTAGVLMVFH